MSWVKCLQSTDHPENRESLIDGWRVLYRFTIWSHQEFHTKGDGTDGATISTAWLFSWPSCFYTYCINTDPFSLGGIDMPIGWVKNLTWHKSEVVELLIRGSNSKTLGHECGSKWLNRNKMAGIREYRTTSYLSLYDHFNLNIFWDPFGTIFVIKRVASMDQLLHTWSSFYHQVF